MEALDERQCCKALGTKGAAKKNCSKLLQKEKICWFVEVLLLWQRER
jgi:hypothetical protein